MRSKFYGPRLRVLPIPNVIQPLPSSSLKLRCKSVRHLLEYPVVWQQNILHISSYGRRYSEFTCVLVCNLELHYDLYRENKAQSQKGYGYGIIR
mmetsp:Transcript_37687/g.51032  ORF Transcript_37687/g.51032 Transcript_37687/m.51032 type:complete len:94 (-) Transcript_37687:329-610(-)